MLSAMQRPISNALGVVVIALSACASTAHTRGLDDPEPAVRLEAMREIAERGDRSPDTLRRLVEQLDSDDQLVRLVAITVLEDLTGDRHGYDPDAPPRQRQEAIARWVEALSPSQSAGVVQHHG